MPPGAGRDESSARGALLRSILISVAHRPTPVPGRPAAARSAPGPAPAGATASSRRGTRAPRRRLRPHGVVEEAGQRPRSTGVRLEDLLDHGLCASRGCPRRSSTAASWIVEPQVVRVALEAPCAGPSRASAGGPSRLDQAGQLLGGERRDPGRVVRGGELVQELAGLLRLVQPLEVERQAEAGLGLPGIGFEEAAQELDRRSRAGRSSRRSWPAPSRAAVFWPSSSTAWWNISAAGSCCATAEQQPARGWSAAGWRPGPPPREPDCWW